MEMLSITFVVKLVWKRLTPVGVVMFWTVTQTYNCVPVVTELTVETPSAAFCSVVLKSGWGRVGSAKAVTATALHVRNEVEKRYGDPELALVISLPFVGQLPAESVMQVVISGVA